MPEEKQEDQTSQKGNEEDTSQKPSENQDGGDSVEDIKAKNKQLYARAKKAEKKLKEKDAKLKMNEKEEDEEAEEKSEYTSDPRNIAKTVVALKDYSADEIDYIFEQAEYKGISPAKAAEDKDVQLFLEAKREKRSKEEKTPKPSTKQSPAQKDYSQWTNEDLRKASENENWDAIDGFRKWAREQD